MNHGIYSLQSFHTANIVDPIIKTNKPKHKNLTLSNEPWKWGQVKKKTTSLTCIIKIIKKILCLEVVS